MLNRRPGKSFGRPTYANVVATLALFVALGGGAYAATTAAKNSVTSKSVVNESLTGKDVKSNSLTGSDLNEGSLGEVPEAASAAAVAANAITGAGVQDNSLGGSDIDESTLNLPAAPAAPNESTPISARLGPNTGFQTLFEGNGIRLEAECANALGEANFRVDLLEAGVLQRTLHFDSTIPTIQTISGPADDTSSVGLGVNGEANLEYFWRRASEGKSATITLGVTNDNVGVGTDCVYTGSAAAE